MQANELRIGNWVKDVKTNTFVEADYITVQGYFAVVDEHYDDYKRQIEPEPIPLTPEILEKAGFFDKWDYWENHLGLKLWFDGVGYYHINSEINVRFDYLHQLQNFYFACAGEELIIEL